MPTDLTPIALTIHEQGYRTCPHSHVGRVTEIVVGWTKPFRFDGFKCGWCGARWDGARWIGGNIYAPPIPAIIFAPRKLP